MTTKRILFWLLMATTIAICQDVRISDEPAKPAFSEVFVPNGTNQTIAICYARSVLTTGPRVTTKVAISAISKASPAVVTSVGHGIHASARPAVTISGATGTGWVPGINGTFVGTYIDADTFSLATTAGVSVDSSGFGTLAGTVVFTTTGPRTTVAEWAIQKLTYDVSGNVIGKNWLYGSSDFVARCSDASGTTVQQQ